MPKGRVEEETDPVEAEQMLTDLARDVAGQDKQKQEEYRKKIKDLPFVLESVDFPGNMFMTVHHIGNQVVIRLNTRHRFYREMWEPIKSRYRSATPVRFLAPKRSAQPDGQSRR